MQEVPYRNRPPSEYHRYLCQFSEMKLKAMQDAFLAGHDLLPFLEGKSFSYTHPTPANYEEFYNSTVPLTTAVSWSLAAPEALHFGKVKNTIRTSTENSTVSESWESARRPPPGPLDSVIQGEFCSLSGWMKDWKGSSQHLRAIKMAISGSQEELGRDKFGVRIIGHADFGLKRVGWPITDTPAIPYDRPVPLYYRSLAVLNDTAEPVVLLDVCGVPSNEETFSLKDDFALAHHYDVSEAQHHRSSETSFGVVLQSGAEYQVMVELRCSPQDIAWHQQWILFLFGRGGSLQHTHNEVFAIGRRVSALVGHNIQDVRSCLSTEAKPFYPAYLRQLFDTRPTELKGHSYLKSSDWRKRLDAFEQTHVSSVWPLQLAKLEEALYYGVLTSGLLSNTSIDLRPCACTVVQLRQFSRLLALEEAAMERDIKEHDLFNVQLSRRDASVFILEVPGLPENRPSVFAGDIVYIRWERYPGMECAADVVAVEFQPKPQLTLKLPEYFLKWCPLLPKPLLVHVRFTFNRLVLTRMHRALQKVAILSMKLLPCICSKVSTTKVKDASISDSPQAVESSDIITRVEIPKPLLKACGIVEHRGAMKSLNQEQWKAVTSVVDRVHGAGPYIILGPPGTGKTVTVVECVLQVLATDPSARLCVCAPSNYAADILCSGIAAGGVDRSMMWRMNDPRRIIASVKVDVSPFCAYQLKSELDDMKSFRVIVCTCGAAGMLHEPPYLGKVEPFSHVFVDEAGQALLPEALIPLSLAHSNACRVLCGDPKQLGPVVHSRLATGKGLDDSLISRFEKSEEYHSNIGGVGSPVIKLVRNYRANAKLLELPSRMFYNNELIAAAQSHMVTPPKDWEELKGRDFPMLFYGVKGQQMREGESPSYFNPVEARKVVDLVSGLISKTHISAGDIGVMAPYRRQVYKLRLILRSRALGAVRVGTVDDYQGQEEKIVFISTVLTRPESLCKVQADVKDNQIGFLGNAKRFNVAITRAKAMLVVVGHPLVLAQDENWSELLRYCLVRDAFRGFGSQYVPPFRARESAWHAEMEDSSVPNEHNTDHINTSEALEIAKAIEKMAELSLLGMGHVDTLYPEDLDSMYSAFSEEMEWRVQL
ncbi:hypothetical protein MPTK1_5g00070 [Marchantia polymorpha subsp. ruderalis]|uniref:RNA helicase n=2 Tax=Marchantia polymorpha TaxID=3197 RepID=A0AAF6BDA6_MARPO|nr:hypothetical protein MARPO_0078s0007 [Marchantia polymorpha]BBN09990.1 hypothetical protein Mp_5g00070 [Marchantia polymorpha subsp. ruderalis]|eukprot:PTQ34583.1 hypothetical protein MARPO_0078s0007 [Marchantia polymorpha]